MEAAARRVLGVKAMPLCAPAVFFPKPKDSEKEI